MTTRIEAFESAYAEALAASILKYPDKYHYGVEAVPSVARKMTAAIAAGTAFVQSPAVQATCRKYGLPRTRKGLMAWFSCTDPFELVEVPPKPRAPIFAYDKKVWTKSDVTIHGKPPKTVTGAYVLIGGYMAVHKDVSGRGWAITHVPTTLSLSRGEKAFVRCRDAMDLATALEAAGDWAHADAHSIPRTAMVAARELVEAAKPKTVGPRKTKRRA